MDHSINPKAEVDLAKIHVESREKFADGRPRFRMTVEVIPSNDDNSATRKAGDS